MEPTRLGYNIILTHRGFLESAGPSSRSAGTRSSSGLQAALEVERVHFFRAQDELELWGSSQAEPEPMKNTIETASSLSCIKTGKFNLEPNSRFFKNQALWASSLGLIYCELKIRPGPSSPSPGSFHLQPALNFYSWTSLNVLSLSRSRYLSDFFWPEAALVVAQSRARQNYENSFFKATE